MKILDDVIVYFSGYECLVQVDTYSHNDRIALTLIDANDPSDAVATATVNIPDQPIGYNQVFIKEWSENQGITAALQQAGVIGRVLDVVPCGYVAATKHELFI